MEQYHKLISDILNKGVRKESGRSNMPGTLSLFGYQMRFLLQEGFPIITTKPIHWKSIVYELLWFLRGDDNIKFLSLAGVNIWNEDAYNYYVNRLKKEGREDEAIPFETFEEYVKGKLAFTDEDLIQLREHLPKGYELGDTGFQYPRVWRNWATGVKTTKNIGFYPNGERKVEVVDEGLDQIGNLILSLKNNPMSRRHILTSWDPAHTDDVALHWCHAFIQFNCRPIPFETKLELAKRDPSIEMENVYITEAAAGSIGNIPQFYLDCHLYQRSADTMLGVPFNISSYSLLTHILGKMCNMIPGELVHSFGDVHIYENHIDAAKEQLERSYEAYPLPTLEINETATKVLQGDKFLDELFTFISPNDFELKNYKHYPKLTNPTPLNTGK